MARTRIGEMLVAQGRIDALQLASALAHQRQWGGRIGNAIVRLGFLPEAAVLEAVGQQLGVPFVEIGERHIPPQVLALVPERLMRTRRVVPLARLSDTRRGPLVVALADPGDLGSLDEIAFATGMQVKPVLAGEADIERALARVLDGTLSSGQTGFAGRKEGVDLPEDTNPLTILRNKTPLH
jgi:type IV pilus assembly protein PilB